MKVTDKGHYAEVELETHNGQQTFLSGMKSKNAEDRREWQRDPETIELAQYMMNHDRSQQIVVKCGDVHKHIK